MFRTKPLVSLLLASLAVSTPGVFAQKLPPPAASVVMKGGTPVKLHFAKTISSANAHKGDRLEFVVEKSVVVDGYTVITAGEIAQGSVVEVKSKRLLGM